MKKTLLIFLALLAWHAATLRGANREMLRLDMDRGLSNNYIMGIAQDRRGFVWLSTESGLNRFDGRDFEVLRKADGILSADELNRIYADTLTNTLWVCTQRHGIDAIDCDSYAVRHFRAPRLSADGVTDVAGGPGGKIWVATYFGGLNLIEDGGERITHFNRATTPDWPDDNLWTVATDRRGCVYLGHVGAGFSIFDPTTGKIENYRHDDADPRSLPGDAVRTVFIDRQDNVWVGTNGGLALFNPSDGTFTTFRYDDSRPGSLISNTVYHISQDRAGRLWISTENGGVSVLDVRLAFMRAPSEIDFENILPGDPEGFNVSNKTIHATFEDSFGNIWIGTYGDGIDIVSRRKLPVSRIHTRSLPVSASFNSVMSMCASGADTIYAGTDGMGIDIFSDGRRLRNLRSGNSALSSNDILALMRGDDGRIWTGAYSGTVNTIDPGSLQISRVDIPGSVDVRCFATTSDGCVLAGCGSGIAEISPDGAVTTHYAADGRLHEEWIRALHVAPDGKIWVGSFGNGISIYDRSFHRLHALDSESGLRSNTVNHLAAGAAGEIWAATGDGLARIAPDGRLLHIYDSDDGMADNDVRALTFDSDGILWMSTASGISSLDPADGSISNFGKADGISGGDFHGGSTAMTPDGTIFFGSHFGIFSFNPRELAQVQESPRPLISGVTVYGSSPGDDDLRIHHPAGSLSLTHDQNNLLVNFSVLDASVNPMVDWSYNVEGIDNRWYAAGEQNNVLLRNLPPGDYRLAVKATVRNQPDSAAVATLPFTVSPPLYARWWAKLIYFLIAAAAAVAALRFYKKRLDIESELTIERRNNRHEQNLYAERMRFFTNITHELRTPLTLILGPLEDIMADRSLTPSQTKRVTMIHKSASRLLELINTILEFRKTETQNRSLRVEHTDLATLVKEIGARYRELNNNAAIAVVTEIEPGDYKLWFDPEVLRMIVDNLMSNACKYTVEGTVRLRLYHSTESGVPFTEISVSDTGLGMDEETLQRIFDRYYRDAKTETRLGTGIGLALVYNLVQLHQGEIFVDSKPGKGSTFRFRLHTESSYPAAERRQAAGSAAPAGEGDKSGGATAADSAGEKARILLVDDNIDILNYIRESLAGDYDVVTATDGLDGLEKARNLHPDLIVSDVMMPKMDGIGMVRALKDDPATSFIPIIIATAKIADLARVEAYETGADSFITKPFSSKLLRSRIRNILDTRHMLADRALTHADTGRAEAAAPAAADDSPIVSKLGELDADFLAKVERVVVDNIADENLDVRFIADRMCMSHSTLYRRVKATTGLSVAGLVRKLKARHAAGLLRTGRHTVSEVALLVGMGSQANFRQCFRDEFGMTPSEFLGTKA